MKRKLPRVYWDSSCFIAWLKPEPARKAQCQEVLLAAEKGELEIVTSAISLVEVVKLDKGPLQIPAEREKRIKGFFNRGYIIVVQTTRFMAESARGLVWSQGLKPRDSIHVATALSSRLDEMHSFDGAHLKLDGKLGVPPLRITHPRTVQALLTFENPDDLALDYEEEEADETN